jgi:hypothetical protein
LRDLADAFGRRKVFALRHHELYTLDPLVTMK